MESCCPNCESVWDFTIDVINGKEMWYCEHCKETYYICPQCGGPVVKTDDKRLLCLGCDNEGWVLENGDFVYKFTIPYDYEDLYE